VTWACSSGSKRLPGRANRAGTVISSRPCVWSALGVCRVKAALSSGCKSDPAIAPAPSNQSSYGGNEIAGAGLTASQPIRETLTASLARTGNGKVAAEHESDARRFWDAMRERLQEFSLSLHPEKTRLIEFGRHAAARHVQRGVGKPETFNFLGFRFICGKSRRGKFLLTRKTRRDRMRAKLKEIKEELRKRMHQPIPEQGTWLKQVVAGFYNYHAVPTNGHALWSFRDEVTRRWQQTLGRRSQKGELNWSRMTRLANAWLPKPRILHPWPDKRFAVSTRGKRSRMHQTCTYGSKRGAGSNPRS
jgi:hypothetical protein